MAFEIITKIKINASAERIWEVFAAFDQYRDWNPFMKSIEGEVVPGKQIFVTVEGMSFKPTVLEFEKHKKLVWRGTLLHSALFSGTHAFEIEPLRDNSCIFHHTERFGGILLLLLKRKLTNETIPGFESMNEALKQLAES
ncbi:MAG: SRPBCC domain-containing protein [Bacteroidota bacterium]